jgi:predicted nucleic acid-binding Zn finger protein
MTAQNGVLEKRYRMVVARVGVNKYAVLSLNSTNGKPSQYVVVYNGSRFQCNCPDFLKHVDKPYYACKHVQAVYEAMKHMVGLEEAVEVEINKKVRLSRNDHDGSNGNEEKKPLIIPKKKAKMFWNE